MSKTPPKKEKLRRLLLLGLAAVAGLYVYFEYLLAPLSQCETRAQREIHQLEPQISKAQAQIKRTRTIAASDPHAETAKVVFAALEKEIPAEASVAWVPQRFGAFFQSHGIQKVTYRLTGEENDPDIPGYKQSRWEIGIPAVEFPRFARALAEWENQEGLLQVTHLHIIASPNDVERQNVSLKLKTVVKP